MAFENAEQVKEVRGADRANSELAAGWSVLGVVQGYDGKTGHALYILGKLITDEDIATRARNRRKTVIDRLSQVCESAARRLDGYDFALEVLGEYADDARAGRLDPRRLRGFLQGLYAGGILSAEEWDELDRDLL